VNGRKDRPADPIEPRVCSAQNPGVAKTGPPQAQPAREQHPDPVDVVFRAALAAAATGLLVTGAVAVFKTTNGAGSAALLGAGAALALLAYAGERLQHLKAGGVEADFLIRARTLVEGANVADAAGAPEVGDQLRSLAMQSLQQAHQVARTYEEARRAMAPGQDRTLKSIDLWLEARRKARTWDISPEELGRMFKEGSEGERIAALALMMERPELRDLDLLLTTIETPHSGFEQYRAMLVAGELLPTLSKEQALRLKEAIRGQEGPGGIDPQTARWKLSRRILQEIDARP